MTQQLLLGPSARRVEEALARLERERVLVRLWDRDAGLWPADPAVKAAIRDRLGWLSILEAMPQQTASLQAFAREIREAGFTHALLLGMGGSSLFADVCSQVFGAAAGHPDLTVLDTTDPAAIRRAQERAPVKQLLAIISSKSGSTAEVDALSRYFRDLFDKADGAFGPHCVVVTDEGTPLEAQAKAWRVRRLFTLGAASGRDIGGRFAALTYFGLVPASLLGIDAAALLARARAMVARCTAGVPLRSNPAAQLGAALGAFAAEGRDKLTLVCAPPLSSFSTWLEQLVAESSGKQGRGIVPILGEPLRPPSDYGPDRLFVDLQLAVQRDPAIDRLTASLASAGHPVIRILLQDPYDLGGEVLKWSVATAIMGWMLDVNPFDEPDVNQSKDHTKALVAAYAKNRRLPDEAPLLTEEDLAVYGAAPGGDSRTLVGCLSTFLQQLRPSDYLGLLSFLPRTPELDQAVGSLRSALARGLPNATTLGIGPRYLHSTGQLFKGGPDSGLFLFLTADDPADLAIPGEPITFGVLKQAQALGDFQAMQQRGRRVLRIHLRGELSRSAARLLSAVDEALASSSRR
jgi:glucose-6-phosphate isomerase